MDGNQNILLALWCPILAFPLGKFQNFRESPRPRRNNRRLRSVFANEGISQRLESVGNISGEEMTGGEGRLHFLVSKSKEQVDQPVVHITDILCQSNVAFCRVAFGSPFNLPSAGC